MLGSAHRALREASQHALPHLFDASGEARFGTAWQANRLPLITDMAGKFA
jgi:hypothetical protein